MTTNQTIDGVPRETLEVMLTAHQAWPSYDKARKELRALLDAPSVSTPLSIPDECPHMIVFDDADREQMVFAGAGSRDAALKTWEKISNSWNAHLFVRIARNSRDDRYPSAAFVPAARPQGEPVAWRCVAAINGKHYITEESPDRQQKRIDSSEPGHYLFASEPLYLGTSEQPQGDPVEIGYIEHSRDIEWDEAAVNNRLIWTMPPDQRHKIPQHYKVMLYAEQPAPVAVHEEFEFCKWTHEVIEESRIGGVTIKIQRMQHLAPGEEKSAHDAWMARAALSTKSR